MENWTDWRNWMLGIFVIALGYFWKRDDVRKSERDILLNDLHDAVLAMQGAVDVLKKSHEFHEQTIRDIRQERRDCELRCPMRNK